MKVKLLSEGARLPEKATVRSAGFDLYTPANAIIYPGRNVVPLNIAMAIPLGLEGQIRPRSGFSVKGVEGFPYFNEDSINNPGTDSQRYDADVILGTIDSDYRGNVGVIIQSHESTPFIIGKGTRIAQLVIAPYTIVGVEESAMLDDTVRGEGGFGHTGTK